MSSVPIITRIESKFIKRMLNIEGTCKILMGGGYAMSGRNSKPERNGPKSEPSRLDQFADKGSPAPQGTRKDC